MAPDRRRALSFAVALPFAAAGVQVLLWGFLEPFAWSLFYPVVFVAAWWGGYSAGLVSTFLSTSLVWLVFLPPEWALLKNDPKYFVSAPVFIATGVLFSVFQERFRGANERTRRSEAKLDAIVSLSADAIITIDEDQRIVLYNRGAEAIFGFRRDEVLGRHIDVLIPQRFREAHARSVREFAAGADGARIMHHGRPTVVGIRKSGEEFPADASISRMQVEGKVVCTVTLRDVTERVRMGEAAETLRQRLLNAVESIEDEFALFDADDRLVLCNSAFRQSVPDELGGAIVGRSFEDLFDSRLDHGFFDLGTEARDELRRRRFAYRREPRGGFDVRTADGRSLRITDRRTFEGGTVTTIWDLTHDVRREGELREARAAAEAASAAKSEFLASMSHELRTPLNAVLGFAQLLQRDKREPLSDRHQEMLGYVTKGGEHLLRLIDEILDLSRIEAGRVTLSPEPVSVPSVLREVVATLEPMAARAEVELVVAPLAADLPPILADRTRCAQVLMNYGSNAIKYGRAGGRATFSALETGGRVRLAVADTGLGIAAGKRDKIFQPFQRAGQETGPIEGTGIGLAISKRLAEMMDGSVGFSSAPGEGSEFWLELPVCPAAAEAAPPSGTPAREIRTSLHEDGPRCTVVYVEDNPSSVALMETLLAGFERVDLITAPTAEIGVELVRAHRPAVVIMDINLPGMSGFEALRKLREWHETRNVPVIALSAAAMEGHAKRAAEAGFSRYLTKPVKVDELVAELDRLLPPPPRPADPLPRPGGTPA